MSNTKQETIEAAAKRERDATREKSSQVGNAAKMREALERIRKELILDSCRHTITKFHDIVCEVSYSALSAPPRNCDVGTAEEQVRRHLEWCERNAYKCQSTPSCAVCLAEWAQMPYEEAKGEMK